MADTIVAGALRRCRMTSLGNVIPRNVEDARVLHAAGLCWSPDHWWHPLNRAGWGALEALKIEDAA